MHRAYLGVYSIKTFSVRDTDDSLKLWFCYVKVVNIIVVWSLYILWLWSVWFVVLRFETDVAEIYILNVFFHFVIKLFRC